MEEEGLLVTPATGSGRTGVVLSGHEVITDYIRDNVWRIVASHRVRCELVFSDKPLGL